MKFAALVAAAAASPTQFVVDNWWNEAQNVFNFAQTNWQQFASAADNVSTTPFFIITPLFITTLDTKPSTDAKVKLRSQTPTGNHSGTSATLMVMLKLHPLN